MHVGDFSVCVMVDGNPLEEYDVVEDEEKLTATCYVASQVGKKFTVRWTCLLEGKTYDSNGIVTVDGGRCEGILQWGDRLPPRKSSMCSEIHLDGSTVRDLMFADVKLTDDETYLHAGTLEKLGEISLQILRGKIGAPTGCPVNQNGTKDGRMIHKRSKTAAVHCVRFGEVRKRSEPLRVYRFRSTYSSLDFTFKYRPLPVLQAQGIAPPPLLESPEEGPEELQTNMKELSGSGSSTAEPAQASRTIENVVRREPYQSNLGPHIMILDARIYALEVELTQLREARARAVASAAVVKTDPDERPAKRVKHSCCLLLDSRSYRALCCL